VGASTPVHSARQRWSLDSLDWEAIRRTRDARDEDFFYLVAAASFMEITTDRYTRNLIDKFAGDDEITTWLERHWLPEELQHGEALRRYVRTAWPQFDWDRVYAAFIDEFETYCGAEKLEPTRSREMASRCVVEMGTASFYTTLSRTSREPVLAMLARRIAEDEIRHYKYFYRYFRRYQQTEPANRRHVAAAIWNRLRMIDGEDNAVAIKHLYAARHPGKAFDRKVYNHIRRGSKELIGRQFPLRMSVRMLLRPLSLGRRAQHIVAPLAEAVLRRVVS